jgi:hypothetical protein
MNEKPYQLVYDASVQALGDQATVLESLRGRAGTVFAATALVTFLGGQTITQAEPGPFPFGMGWWSAGGAAVGLFVLLALVTLAILWPYNLRFSVSARKILAIVSSREATPRPVDAIEALRELALQYEAMYDHNARTIKPLLWCFRSAIVVLVLEVGAWIEVLRELQ